MDGVQAEQLQVVSTQAHYFQHFHRPTVALIWPPQSSIDTSGVRSTAMPGCG